MENLSENLHNITHSLARIETRFDNLESLLTEIARKVNRSQTDPTYIPLADAAVMIGKSKPALQKILQREASKADGLKVRRIRGSVHRKDFLHFVEHKASKHRGRGEIIRAAIKEIER